MSLNITVASPKLIICATDRRLTDGNTGSVVTERSTKLTMLRCIDALALITYNGVGRFQGKTPSDWLQELDSKIGLTRIRFKDVLQAVRQDAQDRMKHIPKQHRRHTFVLGVWGRGRTWICVISNYECAGKSGACDVASDQFEISALPQNNGMETRVLVTGTTENFDKVDGRRIVQVAKKAGAEGKDIKNLCVMAIQNAAHRRKRGPVGSSVIWAIAERYKDVEGGLDVPGGTQVVEMPNMIVPGSQSKDIRVEGSRGAPLSFGKPFPLPEEPCKSCCNPIPLGYRHLSSLRHDSSLRFAEIRVILPRKNPEPGGPEFQHANRGRHVPNFSVSCAATTLAPGPFSSSRIVRSQQPSSRTRFGCLCATVVAEEVAVRQRTRAKTAVSETLPLEEQIRRRAYEPLRRTRQRIRIGLDDWLRAEEEVRSSLEQALEADVSHAG